jgi:hypothetical protein
MAIDAKLRVTVAVILLSTKPYPSIAGNIWNQPSSISDLDGYLEITGTVPAYPAGDNLGCSLQDIADPKGTHYIPAVCARIKATLPPNTVLARYERFAKLSGSNKWLECKHQNIGSAAGINCDPNEVIHLNNGLTAKRYCPTIQRDTCGDDENVDFTLGRANYGCANLNPELRNIEFSLSHISRTDSYDYYIRVYYKKCGNSGPLESN